MTGQPFYGSNNQGITVSGLNGLANGSTAFSNALSNTNTIPFADYHVGGTFKTNASGVSATGSISILVAAAVNGTYPSNVADCKVLAVLTANSNALSLLLDASSIAALYGGRPPQNFKIGVVNNSGAALDNSGSLNALFYQGVNDQLL